MSKVTSKQDLILKIGSIYKDSRLTFPDIFSLHLLYYFRDQKIYPGLIYRNTGYYNIYYTTIVLEKLGFIRSVSTKLSKYIEFCDVEWYFDFYDCINLSLDQLMQLYPLVRGRNKYLVFLTCLINGIGSFDHNQVEHMLGINHDSFYTALYTLQRQSVIGFEIYSSHKKEYYLYKIAHIEEKPLINLEFEGL